MMSNPIEPRYKPMISDQNGQSSSVSQTYMSKRIQWNKSSSNIKVNLLHLYIENATYKCSFVIYLSWLKDVRSISFCKSLKLGECNIYITESLRKLNTAKYLLYLMSHS